MTNELFIPLQQTGDTSLIGAKGKNLYILALNGFKVPLTYCIPQSAYELFLDRDHLRELIHNALQDSKMNSEARADKARDLILAADFPEDLSCELSTYDFLKETGPGFAVRSSSNMEDLPGTSFAGLYDSYLNVHGIDNILVAIKNCWASLWSRRALAYREKYQLDHMKASMAVIIQPMVEALYSGVCFTRNPAGDNGRMYLDYCEGIGDNLLSGRVAPSSCEIDKKSHKIIHLNTNINKAIRDEELCGLADIFQRIETHFGQPQDIEWAITANDIYILQSRPVATKASHITADQVWTRANIGEVLPHVITPLTWDIFRATLSGPGSLDNNAFDALDRKPGVVRLIQGRGFLRMDHFLNSFCYLPAVTPQLMTRALGVNIPEYSGSYSRPSGFLIRLAQAVFLVDALGLAPRLRWMSDRLPPLPETGNGSINEIMKWTAQCFSLHIKATAYSIGAFGLLTMLLRRWMPSESESLLPAILLGRKEMQSAAQGIGLWDLARHVRADQSMVDLFKDNMEISDLEQCLSETEKGRHFLELFRSFLDENGARAAGELELSVPRWREDPFFVWSTLRKYLDSGTEALNYSPQSASRNRDEILVRIKATLPVNKWLLFSRILSSYGGYVTCRENLKYRLIEGFEKLRGLFLSVGRHMADRDILETADDVFFLRASEVFSFIKDNDSSSMKNIVLERKEYFEFCETQAVSELVVGDKNEKLESQPGALKGIACSPGIAEGFARVLFDTSSTDSLKPGEILVAPHTDPGWTPLFLICKALVTEIGGFLSHGATVAREYGIPAVVNVQGATQRIHTGDFISVNGDTGLVQVLKQA
jgi:rifampicin phosphotransferase